MWFYPFLMLRHLFANSWPRTVLKTLILVCTYFLTLAVVMFAAAVAIFVLL